MMIDKVLLVLTVCTIHCYGQVRSLTPPNAEGCPPGFVQLTTEHECHDCRDLNSHPHGNVGGAFCELCDICNRDVNLGTTYNYCLNERYINECDTAPVTPLDGSHATEQFNPSAPPIHGTTEHRERPIGPPTDGDGAFIDQDTPGRGGEDGWPGEHGPTGAQGPEGANGQRQPTGDAADEGEHGPSGHGGGGDDHSEYGYDDDLVAFEDDDSNNQPEVSTDEIEQPIANREKAGEDESNEEYTYAATPDDDNKHISNIDFIPSSRHNPKNAVEEINKNKDSGPDPQKIMYIVVSVVAVIAALVLFVFAKGAHYRYQHNQISKPTIKKEDSPYVIGKDGSTAFRDLKALDDDDEARLLEGSSFGSLTSSNLKPSTPASPSSEQRGRSTSTATAKKPGFNARSKSVENFDQVTYQPKMPTYMDVKVTKRGAETSVDFYRRTASAEENDLSLHSTPPIKRRGSLPSLSYTNEAHSLDVEIKGEEKRAVIGRLAGQLPAIPDSCGLVRHCSLKMYDHVLPVPFKTTSSLDSLQKKAVKNSQLLGNVALGSKPSVGSKPPRQLYKQLLPVNTIEQLADAMEATLTQPKSAVELYIPPHAVPSNQRYIIRRTIYTDLQPFMRYIDHTQGEFFVGPVVEYTVVGGRQFHRPVCVRVPHCVKDFESLSEIRVQYSSDYVTYHDVSKERKQNNVNQDIFFTVDEVYVKIYTTHFTRFLCSCRKRPEIQMEMMLFASYSCLDEQEVALRVYLCNVLYTIKDFKQALISKEKSEPIKTTSVNLPKDGLHKDDEFVVELKIKDKVWLPQTIDDQVDIHKLVQSKRAIDLYSCHLGIYEAPVAAEYVMVPADTTKTRLTFIKGVIEVNMKEVSRKLKKSKNPLAFITKKSDDKKASVVAPAVEPTKLWFAYEFNKNSSPSISPEITSSDHRLDKELLNAFVLVSEHLPIKDFKPLARTLGLRETDFEELEVRHAKNLREMKYQGLLLWHQRESPKHKANMDELVSTLARLGLQDLVYLITDEDDTTNNRYADNSGYYQDDVEFPDDLSTIEKNNKNRDVNIYQPCNKLDTSLNSETSRKFVVTNNDISSNNHSGRISSLPRYSQAVNMSPKSPVSVENGVSMNGNVVVHRGFAEDVVKREAVTPLRSANAETSIDMKSSFDSSCCDSDKLHSQSDNRSIALREGSQTLLANNRQGCVVIDNVKHYPNETKRLMRPDEQNSCLEDRFSTEYEPTFKSNSINMTSFVPNSGTDSCYIDVSDSNSKSVHYAVPTGSENV